ncbi:MAG: hypothetical protein FWC41_00380 [Firmicutes bacterium]|nr:hypothetical protein [Bacillota bacterium]
MKENMIYFIGAFLLFGIFVFNDDTIQRITRNISFVLKTAVLLIAIIIGYKTFFIKNDDGMVQANFTMPASIQNVIDKAKNKE